MDENVAQAGLELHSPLACRIDCGRNLFQKKQQFSQSQRTPRTQEIDESEAFKPLESDKAEIFFALGCKNLNEVRMQHRRQERCSLFNFIEQIRRRRENANRDACA